MTDPRCSAARVGCRVALGWLLGCSGAHAAAEAERAPAPPQTELQELFAAVQTARLFPDQKLFADAVPRASPAVILARYRAQPPVAAAGLRQFVLAHFDLPAQPGGSVPSELRGMWPESPGALVRLCAPEADASCRAQARVHELAAHIDALWSRLTRDSRTVPVGGSLLPLPEPYVVPGGRFRELYYWDSYFTMLGLAAAGRSDLIESMVADFAQLIDRYGHVPNGTRTYYLSRSQPPFFFAMVALLAPAEPPASFARYLPELRREHDFWMSGERGLQPGHARRRVVALPGGAVLNRYWDDLARPRDESFAEDLELARRSGRPPQGLYRNVRAAAESGWDFSSRWFAGTQRGSLRTTDIVPIDLNSLLFGLEEAIRAGCARVGDGRCEEEYAGRVVRRRRAMDRYLWNPAHGVYTDYLWRAGAPSARLSAAMVYPLWVQAASPAQAQRVASYVAQALLARGGLLTTTARTGEQWDAPNGWAPLQWLAVEGLRRYGQMNPARSIACRFGRTALEVYLATGKLVEKYDVMDTARPGGGGEYPTQDGFGWTNGVLRKLIDLYGGAIGATEPCS